MPYAFKAAGRTMHAMPLSGDIDDAALLLGMHHDEDEVYAHLTDQFDVLYAEATKQGGRTTTSCPSPACGRPPARRSSTPGELRQTREPGRGGGVVLLERLDFRQH